VVKIGSITFGQGAGRPPSLAPYTCNCACSRCLSGDCCMNPIQRWWPTQYATRDIYPLVTTTSTFITWSAVCTKCGGSDIGTAWHEQGKKCKSDEGPKGEHLHRTCRTCGYTWRNPIQGAK
jgi:hypothetical protein